jgi:hypothetical protein
MRDLARQVGDGLRERVGYRGAFTVDGVLTADGFLPTELNPRAGAGLSVMARDLPELPVPLLDRALIEGEALAYGADDLEDQVLDVADRSRAGGAWTVTRKGPPTTGANEEVAVAFEDGVCRPATDERPPDGTLTFGPSGVGGFVRLSLDPERVAAGPPVAPLAVAAFALADERFGTGTARWNRPGRSAERERRAPCRGAPSANRCAGLDDPAPASATADGQSVDHQQQDGPDDRGQPGADIEELVDGVATEQHLGQEPAEDGPDDPDDDGHDDAARVVAGQDRLGERSRDQAEDDPTDDAHATSFRCRDGRRPPLTALE